MIRIIFTQKFWHELFEASVFLKALNSLWETIAGIVVLSSTHSFLPDWLLFLGFINRHIDQFSVSTRNFMGLYLLLHGLLNMFLAYNLFKNRLWAYPASMSVIGVFLLYQTYRLAHTHSLFLLLLTVFDIAYLVLTWHEYIHQTRRRRHTHSNA